MNRRITKVSFKEADNKIKIEYQTTNPNNKSLWDDHALSCNDAPIPSFDKALADLIPHGMKLCELTDAYGKTCKTRGISLSYGGDNDTMGATITILKSLKTSNAPLVLNTPHKPVAAYVEGGDESNCLPLDCAIAIENLCNEAERYLDGERSQQCLKLDDETESGEPELGMSVTSVTLKAGDIKNLKKVASKLTESAKASFKKGK